MNILTQNEKMKKSSQGETQVFNFGIPAFQASTGFKTCPNAGVCASGCYARSGTYRFSNVAKAYEAKLALTFSPDFVPIMIGEILEKYRKNRKVTYIRIHDSGDFYNEAYMRRWFEVMQYFINTPDIKFYAYTKMIEMFNTHKSIIPSNFTLIYSYGGKQDHLINPNTDRHSKVFQSDTELLEQGYINANNNDLIALGPNPKIGLVYHGTKKYTNTAWNRVK